MRYDLPVAFKEFEVVTTTDKDQRDRLFEDLRKNGNELERQAVKFSGVEPIMDTNSGKQIFDVRQYYPTLGKDRFKKFNPKVQIRPMWRSTWSVAYPTS
jgi:hypothetical protein